jgi:ABC-type multidrug transport system permease subunit
MVIIVLERIYSQIYKSRVSIKRNSFRLADLTIWPLLYLFPLTFFVTYMGSDDSFLHLIIIGMIGWRMVYFINHEMIGLYVEEYWSKALPHLMLSPISRLEYSIGAAFAGLLKGSFVTVLYLVLTYFLYGFWITDWGTFLLGMFFLALVSLILGFFLLGVAYYIKSKEDAFSVGFIIPDALVLLSGVYFSIESVYPEYLLPFIRLLPSTHAFDVLKSILGFAQADIPMLVATTAVWLVIAYMFNTYMFELARKNGKLTRLG